MGRSPPALHGDTWQVTSALHTCTHLASPGGGGGRVLPRGPSQSLPEGAGSAASPTVWLWEGESPLRPSRKEGTEPGAAPGEVPSLSEPRLRGGTWHSPVPGPRHRGPQRGPGVRQFGDDEVAEAAGQPVCSAASRPAPPPSSPSCVPCLLTGVPENPASSPHGQLSQPGVSPARGPEAAGLSGGLRGSPPGAERVARLSQHWPGSPTRWTGREATPGRPRASLRGPGSRVGVRGRGLRRPSRQVASRGTRSSRPRCHPPRLPLAFETQSLRKVPEEMRRGTPRCGAAGVLPFSAQFPRDILNGARWFHVYRDAGISGETLQKGTELLEPLPLSACPELPRLP